MHASSLQHMQSLADRYLTKGCSMSILDVGSFDVNGSYKPILHRRGARYVGLDLLAGPNVDVVLKSPYFFPLSSNGFDLVVSGQAFEHIEFFWLTWMEMVRVVKPNGLIFLIAPSKGPEHRYPQDCWRYYPDSYRALSKLGNCELLEVSTDWGQYYGAEINVWGDTVGVFRKKNSGLMRQIATIGLRVASRYHAKFAV